MSEDGKKIRRSPNQALPEMNEARRQELMHRSLYVKGFPTENIEVDTLLQYFRKYTKVEQLVVSTILIKSTFFILFIILCKLLLIKSKINKNIILYICS